MSEQKGLNRYFFQETIMHKRLYSSTLTYVFDATHHADHHHHHYRHHHHSQIQSLHTQKRLYHTARTGDGNAKKLKIQSLNINHFPPERGYLE